MEDTEPDRLSRTADSHTSLPFSGAHSTATSEEKPSFSEVYTTTLRVFSPKTTNAVYSMMKIVNNNEVHYWNVATRVNLKISSLEKKTFV